MKAIVLLGVGALTGTSATCLVGTPQGCSDEASCVGVNGVWVPVANALDIPGTAVQGGRRYTLGQSDEQFTKVISAPNGGYCTKQVSPVTAECEADYNKCETMEGCFYRQQGGRWFHTSTSETCVNTCAHPLVFCDKARCQSTLGCGWFIKTQSNADQCYCIDNPGIFGNPPAPPKMTWIFWDQPVSIPIFVIAVIALIAIAWNVWIFNLKPFFLKVFKKKPKE
jgi:hypothetical protein